VGLAARALLPVRMRRMLTALELTHMSESGATAASGQVRHVEHSQNHFPILQLPTLPYPHADTRTHACTMYARKNHPQTTKVYLILRPQSFQAQAVSQSCAHSRSYLSRRCQRNYETDSNSVRDLAYKCHGTPEGLVAFSTDPCTAGYDVNFPSSSQQYAACGSGACGRCSRATYVR